MNAPESIHPEIAHLWPHWNLGRQRKYRIKRENGSARLVPWTMTKDQAGFERARAAINPKAQGRYVPEGRYVRLMIRQDHLDRLTGEPTNDWQIVMSDTPDEMNDHVDPLLHATGRVLIHGLGLGCVLNCVRNLPGVASIDVVEVNEDVLNLVAPLHDSDPRVNFVLGSCVDVKWPPGTRWNYVWHDIWSSIGEENLTNDETAEHGISYATLHRMFGGRCDRQASWAFDNARKAREVERIAHTWASRFAFAWRMSSVDERLEMYTELVTPFGMSVDQYTLTTMYLRVTPDGPTLREQYRKLAEQQDMTEETAYWLMLDRARAYVFNNHPRRKNVAA